MGGTTTTTQQVTIPPEVLARYNAVNATAEKVAQAPFQTYSGQFVAPLSSTQQAGISNTNTAAGIAQPYYQGATGTLLNAQNATSPYYGAATGLMASSAMPVYANQIGANQINQFMSPYLSDVVGSESALLNQNNQQAMSGQLGNAISSGAFGGDRSGIAAAGLAQQQQLANANIYSNLLNQGYGQALSAAQQQQGVNLSAAEANRAALASAASGIAGLGQDIYSTGAATSQALAGLGTGAQAAGLQGAQAQLAAGQLEQQTQQAQDTALYNQFLQQQSYPFQTTQFLANIAEGTGALSGSTQTTQQPVQMIKRGGTVDRHKRYAGGLVPSSEGGAVHEGHAYQGYADGGSPFLPGISPADYGALLQAQAQSFAGLTGGLYGGQQGGSPYGGSSRVPAANLPVAHLTTPGGMPARGPSPTEQMQAMQSLGEGLAKDYTGASDLYKKWASAHPAADQNAGSVSDAAQAMGQQLNAVNAPLSSFPIPADAAPGQAHGGYIHRATGGLAGRGHFDDGGMPYSNQTGGSGLDIPDKQPQNNKLATPSASPGGGSSVLGSVGQLAGGVGSLASGLAAFLPMIGLHTGGAAGDRHHHATGGLAGGRKAYADGGGDITQTSIDPVPVSPEKQLQDDIDLYDQPPTDSDSVQPPKATPVDQAVALARKATAPVQDADQNAGSVSDAARAMGQQLNAVSASSSSLPTPADEAASRGLGEENVTPQAPPTPGPTGGVAAGQGLGAAGVLPVTNAPPSVAPPATGAPSSQDDQYKNFAHALAQFESRGNYKAIGPKVVYKDGSVDHGFGAYQVMGKNIGPWTQEVLGHSMTPQEFLNDSDAQEAVAKAKMGQLYDKYGNYPDVASMWFSGRPLSQAGTRHDVTGTTVPKYIAAIEARGGFPIPAAGLASGSPVSAPVPTTTPPATGVAPPAAPSTPTATPGEAISALTKGVAGAGSFLDRALTNPQTQQGIWNNMKKPEVFIPLLSGLAAMLTSPTRNFGATLGYGLGTAASAEQGQREFGLQQQQLGLEGQRIDVARMQAQAPLLNAALQVLHSYTRVDTIGPDGRPMYRTPKGALITGTQYESIYNDTLSKLSVGQGISGIVAGMSGNAPPTMPGGAPVVTSAPPPSGGEPAPAGATPPPSGATPAKGAPPVKGAPNAPPAPISPSAPHNWKVDNEATRAASGAYSSLQYNPQPMDNSGLAARNPNDLSDEDRPDVLRALAGKRLLDGTISSSEYDAFIERAKLIENGDLSSLPTDKKTNHPFMGYYNRAQQLKTYQDQIAHNQGEIAKVNDEGRSFINSYANYQNVIDSLKQVYKTANTNRMTPEFADAIGRLSSIPMVRSLVPDKLKDFESSSDFGSKLAATQALEKALEDHITRAPAAALGQTNKIVPGVAMSPGARFNLLVQQEADLKRTYDYYNDWFNNNKSGNINNIGLYSSDWSANPTHSYASYKKDAVNNTPYFAGMTPQEKLEATRMGRTPKNWEDGQLVALPAGTILPNGTKLQQEGIGYWSAKTGRIVSKPPGQ